MGNKGAQLTLLLSAGLAVIALRSAAQTGEGENIILGRPTAGSVAMHALADQGSVVFAEYGEVSGQLSSRTDTVESSPDGPAVVTVAGLATDTRYFYRLSYRDPGEAEFRQGEEHSFHTQRRRGATFTLRCAGRFASRAPRQHVQPGPLCPDHGTRRRRPAGSLLHVGR